MGFPETPSEIVLAPTIHLGDKKLQRALHTVLYYGLFYWQNFILLPLKSPSQRSKLRTV